MREVKRTRTIEEVTGYEATDGTYFTTKEECKKYEESALGVLAGRITKYRIGETTIYGLLDEGSDDCGVDIYRIPDADAAQSIAQYVVLQTRDNTYSTMFDKYIGKEVIIMWGYDHDWAGVSTLEELLDTIKSNYDSVVKTYQEKNAKED